MIDYNADRLIEFENQLDPSAPESGSVSAKVLGYGEVSSTFQISGLEGVAFKRMPPFPEDSKRKEYIDSIARYCTALDEQGIKVVETHCRSVDNKEGELIAYIVQPLLPFDRIGNNLLPDMDDRGFAKMLTAVFRCLDQLWAYNDSIIETSKIGLDAQLSNWVFTRGETDEYNLQYLDISTPMMRLGGSEIIDVGIFLKSIPFFLRGLVRRFFLADVLDRYYDLRLVLIDVLANLYKEKRPDLIPAGTEHINRLLAESGRDLLPLTQKEIAAYYREDRFIWTFLLACRRFDRWLTTWLLRRKYNFILPGPIRR